MLIKLSHLKLIKSGVVSLAFRKWKKVSISEGALLNTAVGRIEILSISMITEDDITPEEAGLAGYEDLADLIKELESRSGQLVQIALKYHSADPRLELRKELSEDEFKEVKSKLEGFDKRSKTGKWTLQTLKAIQQHPGLRAQDLANQLGVEKHWLKPNIRKLKNLGLTISLESGYVISKRGTIFLNILSKV